MQALLNHIIEQSLTYTLLAVALVAFLESMALVGLLLPGALMMAGFGALIGSGQLSLYSAWLAAFVGGVLADWLSFGLGWRFKGLVHRSRLARPWLDIIERALHKHNMLTVLLGRFVGPTRPLVPIVAGMLNLSALKFAIPALLGAVLWPPVYFMPGILTGAAIDIPHDAHSILFKWLLLLLALLIWLACWLAWRAWRSARQTVQPASKPQRLTAHQWRGLAMLSGSVTLAALVAIQYHPLMPVYRRLLWQVIAGDAG